MEISWFSYAEDKFFTGKFELPYEQLCTLFSKGRTSPITGEKTAYDTIIIGVAPAGEVSVWLQADGEVLLVSRFFGKEYVGEWSTVSGSKTFSRAEYITEMLKGSLSRDQFESLRKEGVPLEKLRLYRKEYKTSLQAVGQKEMLGWMYCCNGEVEFFDFEKTQNRMHRSAPKLLEIIWQGPFRKWYEAKIALNDSEILQAYETLSSGDPDHNLELLVEVSDNNHVEVSLKDSHYITRLKHVSVKVYQLDSAPIGKESFESVKDR